MEMYILYRVSVNLTLGLGDYFIHGLGVFSDLCGQIDAVDKLHDLRDARMMVVMVIVMVFIIVMMVVLPFLLTVDENGNMGTAYAAFGVGCSKYLYLAAKCSVHAAEEVLTVGVQLQQSSGQHIACAAHGAVYIYSPHLLSSLTFGSILIMLKYFLSSLFISSNSFSALSCCFAVSCSSAPPSRRRTRKSV